MLKKKKLLIILPILIALTSFIVWLYSLQTIDSKIKDDIAEGNSVVLLFSADWCSTCVKQKPVYQEVKKEFPNINFYLIGSDLDRIEQRVLFKLHAIHGLPTMVIFNDGVELKRLTGLQTREDLRKNFIELK